MKLLLLRPVAFVHYVLKKLIFEMFGVSLFIGLYLPRKPNENIKCTHDLVGYRLRREHLEDCRGHVIILKCSLGVMGFFEDRIKWRIFLAVLNLRVLLPCNSSILFEKMKILWYLVHPSACKMCRTFLRRGTCDVTLSVAHKSGPLNSCALLFRRKWFLVYKQSRAILF
jgi:hypothetical protein